jgi:predicted NAD/FAD-binding protein
MRIAVIGAGISGLVSAYLLCRDHEVVVFEAEDYIGGHTHTIDVEAEGTVYPVDTGFIVFNEKTYPNFVKLMRELGVAWKPSHMSFSVRCGRTGLEYCPTSLNSLFAQRRNLLRPAFHRMMLDILRFRKESLALIQSEDEETTLGRYLEERRYSRWFRDYFIIPMGSAIWSADPARFHDFQARSFAAFFHNHGFLNVRDKPQWLVIRGGSREYVEKLIRPFRDAVRLESPVESVFRRETHVEVKPRGGEAERFDRCVIATHSDQALAMLSDPTDAEREVLGALPYQRNRTVLHTDASMLPSRRSCWASWNSFLPREPHEAVTLTYNMNILQGLGAPVDFCVTLNREQDIDPGKMIRSLTYHHPVYTPGGFAAQKRFEEISGKNRTHFCGAYWGYGFHEDGVRSALAACKPFGKGL